MSKTTLDKVKKENQYNNKHYTITITLYSFNNIITVVFETIDTNEQDNKHEKETLDTSLNKYRKMGFKTVSPTWLDNCFT